MRQSNSRDDEGHDDRRSRVFSGDAPRHHENTGHDDRSLTPSEVAANRPQHGALQPIVPFASASSISSDFVAKIRFENICRPL